MGAFRYKSLGRSLILLPMPLNIIIADDHSAVRIGTRSIIERSGAGRVVAEAATAAELMALLATHRCDVLVTDYAMPGSDIPDGYALISNIRRRHPALPILLLSACNNANIIRIIRKAGVLGFVSKSGAAEALPVALRTVQRGSPYPGAMMQAPGHAGDGDPDRPADSRPLTPREIETVRLLGTGLTTNEIAALSHRSPSTVSRQKGDAMLKLGLENEAALFRYVRRSGF